LDNTVSVTIDTRHNNGKKKQKGNLIKLKQTIQVERKRQSAAKSDPVKTLNIL